METEPVLKHTKLPAVRATPGSGWVFAHTVARDEAHPLNAAFDLERFTTGALIDEHGAAGVAH